MRQLKQRLRTSRKANNRWTGLSYASSYTELRSKGIRAYAYIYLTQKLISVFTESSRKAIKTHFLGDREVQRNRNLQSFSNPSHDSVRKKAVYSWFSKSSGVHIYAWTIFQPPQCRADSTQGLNPCLLPLLHWQADSLLLSHQGSPVPSVSWLVWLHSITIL